MRALAVVAILVYHGWPGAARGGFFGVDVFFVLSGYLITSRLVSEAARTGGVRFGAFWARRARRLLPALMVVCAAAVLLSWVFPNMVDVAGLGGDVSATVAYVLNLRFVVSHQPYFGQFAQPSLLQHAWSLAIEEQFYLVWPLVIAGVLVWRRVRPSRLAVACALAALASAIWMAALFHDGASSGRLYYGTDTRAQALLIGAAIGAAGVGRPGHHARPSAARRRVIGALGLAGLAGILACFFLLDDSSAWLYTGGFTVAALCAAALVSDAGQREPSLLGRALGSAPLVAIGVISYGLYLWHWPIDVLVTPARLGFGGSALFGVRAAMTVAMATLSYFLVEMPIRNGALRGGRAWLAMGLAATLVIAGGVAVTETAPRSFTPPASAHQLQPAPTSPTVTSAPGPTLPTRVLVVGDSIAMTLGVGLNDIAASSNLIVSNDGILGCGILRGGDLLVDGRWSPIGANCQQWPTRWASDVELTRPDVVLVLTGTWDAFDRRIGNRVIPFYSAEGQALLAKDLRDALDVLSARGARVIFLTTPYITKQNDPNPPAEYGSAFDRTRVDAFNQLLRTTVGADPRASVVDMNGFLAPGGELARTPDGHLFQPDLVHLGPEGRDAAAAWLAPQIRAAVGSP